MTSVLAIVRAKRIFRSGPATASSGSSASSYPAAIDAILIEGNCITCIAPTAEVEKRYAALLASANAAKVSNKISSAGAPQVARPVVGGRAREAFYRRIDCEGRLAVYPGFIDSHVHFLDGGRMLESPQLSHATDRGQFVAILQQFMSANYSSSGSGWIYGSGWSEAVLGGLPSRDWLDEVSSTVPMMLYSKDVHSCVLNTAALRICHIIPGAADGEPLIRTVAGGRVEVDEKGEPTGVLRDNAIAAAKRYAPPADTPSNQRRALEAATDYMLSRGFTSVFSMMSLTYSDNINEVEFLTQMEASGAMRLRVRYGVPIADAAALVEQLYTRVTATGRRDAFTVPYRFTLTAPEAGGGYVMLGAVKLFSDGSLSSRTAAMNRPYGYGVETEGDIDSDLDDAALSEFFARRGQEQCQCGLLTMTKLELQAAVQLTHAFHLQCCIHAIGDRAVASVNRELCASAGRLKQQAESPAASSAEAAALRSFCRNPRSRVEHCQHIANPAKEIRRMADHQIIASMQPCHLLFDGDYIDELLGQRRKDTSYIWRSLLAAGIRVDLGSDWPVAPAEVRDGLRGSVTRVPDVMVAIAAEKKSEDGSDGSSAATAVMKRYHEAWNLEECISMDAALRAYTYEGAYGMFMEDSIGTLEVGKYADISIWSGDWLDDSGMLPLPGEKGEATRWWPQGEEPQVDFTIVAGIVEYERAQ